LLGPGAPAIELPQGFTVRLDGGRIEVRESAGVRFQRRLTFVLARAGAPPAGARTVALTHGGELSYAVRDLTANGFVGSGGPELLLEGVVVMDGSRWEVTCNDQDEDPSPDWCLEVLRTLRNP
jgi:hypothetical protein